MIESVSNINEDIVIAHKSLKEDEYFFEGHFPGAPVLPGAMMQEMTTQAAGLLITKYHSPVENYNSNSTKGHALGVLKKVCESRFKGFARPLDEITVEVKLKEKVDGLFEFTGKVMRGEETLMKNSFQLVNIVDKHLFH
jgi:3-hydroxyacyl-[acyl-carrier-protein] dehydratase